MIPRKLADLFFSQIWLMLIPVITIPAFVTVILSDEPIYESRATVWVGSNALGSTPFGEGSPYNSRAQNQAQVLNDLLATDVFRSQVAVAAELVDANEDEEARVAVGRRMVVWAGTIGYNIVTIAAQSTSAADSTSIVSAVVDEYLKRATTEAERRAGISAEYYQQQLAIAQAELERRREALDSFLEAGGQSGGLDYQTLQDRVTAQQVVVDQLNSSLQTTARELASSPQSQEAAFALQDEPTVPREPLPVALSSRLIEPAAGIILGLIIAAAYFVIRYRTDHSIRSREDLVGLDVALLASVDEVRPSGLLWRVHPASLVRRHHRLTFARRIAASIPLTEAR